MARQTFYTHPKLLRACHILGAPKPHVIGYMELLWHVAGQAGDPVLGDSLDVEILAEYPQKDGTLAAALVQVRLLDQREDGRLQVHDFFDHAPDYVTARRLREDERKIPRVCAHCRRAYRSTEGHSKFCSDSCRVANHRRKRVAEGGGEGNCNADVTHDNEGVRYSNAGNGQVNVPPSHSPSHSHSRQEDNTPQPPKGGEGRFDPSTLPMPAELATEAFRETWGDWCVYRAEMKKGLKAVGARQQLKKLASYGEAEAIRLLERAMVNGWQGFDFAEKSHDRHGGTVGRAGRVEAPRGKYAGRCDVQAGAAP